MSDWVELLKSIPGAAKAVTELIGEIGRAGAATVRIGTTKANQVSQAIDDDAKARSEISAALTEAAKQYIGANAQQLGQRALERGVSKMLQQQANREAVTVRAIEDLRDDPPPIPPTETPSDDWLNLFGVFAERASTEKMQNHWSRILSGEIRRPGSFSMATLHMASILDERIAKLIEEVVPWLVDDAYIPTVYELNRDPFYSKLLVLDGIGFLRVASGSRRFEIGAVGELLTYTKNRVLQTTLGLNQTFSLPVTFLTVSGRELLKIIQYSDSPGLIPLLQKKFSEHGGKDFVVKDRLNDGPTGV